MHKQKGFTTVELSIAALFLIGAGGWIANVIKFIGMLDGGITAMFIARIVGIFLAPFGAILGFF